jgi:hypothetical protein
MSDQQVLTDEQEDLDERYERLRVGGLPEELQALVGEHHWNMLQAMPSSVEQHAHAFVQEVIL